jgi:hypothetical protein
VVGVEVTHHALAARAVHGNRYPGGLCRRTGRGELTFGFHQLGNVMEAHREAAVGQRTPVHRVASTARLDEFELQVTDIGECDP